MDVRDHSFAGNIDHFFKAFRFEQGEGPFGNARGQRKDALADGRDIVDIDLRGFQRSNIGVLLLEPFMGKDLPPQYLYQDVGYGRPYPLFRPILSLG